MPIRANLALLTAALIFAVGCPAPSPGPSVPTTANSPADQRPLKLLVVDDAPLGEAIAREWKSRTEGTIDVEHVKLAGVLSASRLPGDAIVFPAGYVGDLVERELIVPLDDQALASDKFERREIFDQVRLRDISWGNRTVAVPLGSPQLLLVYRRDLFDKLGLAPPQTWAEYQTILDRLAAEPAEGESKLAAAIEPLADGWAGNLFLARAAAYVAHRDQVSPLFHYTTLEPLIATAPYVRALEELVAAQKHSPPAEPRTPQQALADLCSGRAAMAIAWPNPPAKTATETNAGDLPLGFALLPGAAEVYNFQAQRWEQRGADEERHVPLLGIAGRVGAVTTTTADAARSQEFLAWMASREMSPLIGPASSGTTLHRQSHLSDPARWTSGLDDAAAKSYADTFHQSAALPRFISLRLPGRSEYLAALDEAVQAAVSGDQTPAEALTAASAKWQQITAARGLEKQRAALHRSLGLESLQ
jgi:ABC-type glycerol-3-phosphate transport system substrate-binding protein